MWFNPFDAEFSKEYSELKNKPKINGVELSGNKSWSDLGLANPMHIAGIVDTVQDLPATANEGDVYIVGLQNEEKVEYVYTVNGWEYLGTMAVKVDDAMSTTSENPVQNKVVNAAKQDKIDTNHKLDADLVNDLSSTNKFTTASEKQTWNGKQDAINSSHKLSSDLVDDTNHTNQFVTAAQKTSIDTSETKLTGIASTAANYVELTGGGRLYVSNTEPTGTIPNGAIGVGW